MTVNDAQHDQKTKTAKWSQKIPWQLVTPLLVLALLFAFAQISGLTAFFDQESLRTVINNAGPWGVLIFLCLFSIGLLIQIPGIVFVIVAVLVWGQTTGSVIGLVGAIISLSCSFWTIRLFRGDVLKPPKLPNLLQRLVNKLEEHPIAVVAALRLFMFLSPPVNIALALSPLRYRDYVIGSTIGLIPPFITISLLAEQILKIV